MFWEDCIQQDEINSDSFKFTGIFLPKLINVALVLIQAKCMWEFDLNQEIGHVLASD